MKEPLPDGISDRRIYKRFRVDLPVKFRLMTDFNPLGAEIPGFQPGDAPLTAGSRRMRSGSVKCRCASGRSPEKASSRICAVYRRSKLRRKKKGASGFSPRGSTLMEAESMDIGAGGLGIVLYNELSSGTLLEISINSDSPADCLSVDGCVMWSDKLTNYAWRAGIQFSAPMFIVSFSKLLENSPGELIPDSRFISSLPGSSETRFDSKIMPSNERYRM